MSGIGWVSEEMDEWINEGVRFFENNMNLNTKKMLKFHTKTYHSLTFVIGNNFTIKNALQTH